MVLKRPQRHNFTSGNIAHISTRKLLTQAHTFSSGSWLVITTSRCKIWLTVEFLSESSLMWHHNSSSKVGQQLKYLLEKFSKKYLADQIKIIKLILMLPELKFFKEKEAKTVFISSHRTASYNYKFNWHNPKI